MRAATLTALTIGGYMALFGALGEAARGLVGGAADGLICLMDAPSGAALVAAEIELFIAWNIIEYLS